MTTHIFLSPHYDDAVYSAGGTIHHLASNGQHATVITTMAGIPQPPFPDTPIIRENHQRWNAGENPVYQRRDEDGTALQILGAQGVYLDIPDCIYRQHNTPFYPDEASLWGAVHPDDTAREKLLASLPQHIPDDATVYAPLGVGNHVDHQLVREVALSLCETKREITLLLYLDFPYIRQPGTVQQTLQALPVSYEWVQRTLSENDLIARSRAMAAYRSQISTFWDDASDIEREVRQRYARNNSFIERLVKVKYTRLD